MPGYLTCSRTQAWIDGIDIKADVSGNVLKLLPHCIHQRGEGLVPALLDIHHSHALHKSTANVSDASLITIAILTVCYCSFSI